jgi:hypothetical protein
MTMKRTWLILLAGLLGWQVVRHMPELRAAFKAESVGSQGATASSQAAHLPTTGEVLLVGAVAVCFMVLRRQE